MLELAASREPEPMMPGTAVAEFENMVGELAKELDHGPFLIHAQINEILDSLPLEQRIQMISTVASFNLPSLREAVAGWLLDANASLANAVAGFLAQAAGTRGWNLEGWLVVSHPDDHDAIEGSIGLPVASPVEAMPVRFPARGWNRTGAAEFGESGVGTDAFGIVADEDEHLSCGPRGDPFGFEHGRRAGCRQSLESHGL